MIALLAPVLAVASLLAATAVWVTHRSSGRPVAMVARHCTNPLCADADLPTLFPHCDRCSRPTVERPAEPALSPVPLATVVGAIPLQTRTEPGVCPTRGCRERGLLTWLDHCPACGVPTRQAAQAARHS